MNTERWPEIIREAAQSPLGILALMILVIAVIALVFFRGTQVGVRLFVFLLLFGGVSMFGVAVIRVKGSTAQPVPARIAPRTSQSGTMHPPTALPYGEEQEPNDHVSKANWIEIGNTYRGTLRRERDPLAYFTFSTSGVDAVYVRVLVRVIHSGGGFGNFGVTATLLDYQTEKEIGHETAIYGANLSHAFEVLPDRKYFLRLSLFTNLFHYCTYELRLTPEAEQ
jgi:hypothetical protein